MDFILLFGVSILPGIFWVWYFYRQDYLDPEPWGLVFRSFIAGALTVIPVSLIETSFAIEINRPNNLIDLLFLSIFIIGVTEEVFKFLAAYFSVYRNKEFNEVMDGIIYVVTAGLGFAAVENLFYTTVFGYKVGVIRAVVTSLAHAGFSGIVGFYFGMARCYPERSKFYILYGLAWASLLHGFYDFLVISRLVGFTMTIGIVLLLQLYLARLIRRAEFLSPFK
ncbi:hypothetical protein BBF96_00765 [Anoxybacter fermentans]|uniref:Protease PrsW n=1 Tax=Anoxybacter fermentans TaxID=1323375 RepID=A0A3S9SUU3_9FIRM|nr:PrsW family glutamic-type intramembrane protease [Anoxybacter fermentans]AZR72052.1 hypothetical protein BBF96_00765 [Anoxybacter fermentans]